jgi:hypothetical protein
VTGSGPPRAARGRTAGCGREGLFQTLWHTRMMLPKGGVKPCSSCSMDAKKGMARCGGVTHMGRSRTHWGGWQATGRPALPSGRERGDRRLRTRRRLLSPHEPERSGTGPLPTRCGQAEDQAKASWRTHAGAIGGGSAASFRCRRIFRIISPCVMAAMIRSAPR